MSVFLLGEGTHLSRFAVIDLETANARMHSICQIGVVVFEDGREIASDVAEINPEQPFDPFNVQIHGISTATVSNALCFAQVHEQLARMLKGQIVVSHTPFDRVALEQACDYHQVPRLECHWLDSSRVVRNAWPQYSRRGFGLANLAAELGLEFQHHDALEDARTAGLVLIRAMEASGTDINAWLQRLDRPPAASGERVALRRTGDGDGPLMGETVVFTGNFSQPKRELADLAHIAGAAVEPGVNKLTSMLVVGTQDWSVVGPTGKSEKHRKVEQMIAKGVPILIVTEDDFRELVRGSGGLE